MENDIITGEETLTKLTSQWVNRVALTLNNDCKAKKKLTKFPNFTCLKERGQKLRDKSFF